MPGIRHRASGGRGVQQSTARRLREESEEREAPLSGEGGLEDHRLRQVDGVSTAVRSEGGD